MLASVGGGGGLSSLVQAGSALYSNIAEPSPASTPDYTGQLSSYTARQNNGGATDMTETNSNLATLVDTNKKLLAGFMNGGIQANVNLNGQKVSEAIGRGLLFTGERAPA
jgi:hypothetical protein